MKVLLINPWGVNNDEYYTSGFIAGMNRYADLSFVSNYYYGGTEPNGKIYRVFFKKSEKLKPSKKRKLIRGLEYIRAWKRILRIAKSQEFDIIHIHWLLMYEIDERYVTRLKKYCRKLILTAHNVIPHINGESRVGILRRIYANFDVILVHGESIKAEFGHYFPELLSRVEIQFHGEYFGQSTECCAETDERVIALKEKQDRYDKTFILFGGHFYNKGTDRVAKMWLDNREFDYSRLIIAGRINRSYSEMLALVPELEKRDNVLLLNRYVEDDLLNYLISHSDVVVIPYRHASMSGVLHTAAVFKKPVICTRTGALAEYLMPGRDSLVCENTDEELELALCTALNTERDTLKKMGENLHRNIKEKYSWNVITKKLCDETYRT